MLPLALTSASSASLRPAHVVVLDEFTWVQPQKGANTTNEIQNGRRCWDLEPEMQVQHHGQCQTSVSEYTSEGTWWKTMKRSACLWVSPIKIFLDHADLLLNYFTCFLLTKDLPLSNCPVCLDHTTCLHHPLTGEEPEHSLSHHSLWPWIWIWLRSHYRRTVSVTLLVWNSFTSFCWLWLKDKHRTGRKVEITFKKNVTQASN